MLLLIHWKISYRVKQPTRNLTSQMELVFFQIEKRDGKLAFLLFLFENVNQI